ncbi:MAG: prepilin-type N-terminal cleavage/methylation domain-containing protein [Candidatus Omnitrophica bacterium]|nr:prepilin-type N-terminal cleavage/methylation domain-containing protein [Candidatus Omnitrophota bacterium]
MKTFRGFTLIEVLLGIIILSLISLCLYGVWTAVMKINRDFLNLSDPYRQERLTADLFAQDFARIRMYDLYTTYPKHTVFQGSPNAMVFLIGDEEGLKVVSYYLGEIDRGQQTKTLIGRHYARNVAVVENLDADSPAKSLIRETMDFAPYLSGGFKLNGAKEIILKNIDANGFRMLYAPLPDDSGHIKWQDTWTDAQFPIAVKLQIQGKSRPQEPALLFEKILIVRAALTDQQKK